MKKSLKVLTSLISIAMLTVSLGGCGSKASPTSADGGTDPSKLKKVELTFYDMGEPPKDLDKFYEELDKLTLKDLNCTVRFKFSTWTDWQTKYNLMLTSGEKVDLAYSADWVSYPTNARKGAFEPLDTLLPKYAPTLYKDISQDTWNALKIDGKIYGVPPAYNEFVQHGAVYREDLRQKYGLPEIKDVDSLGTYIKTVKEKEPEMSTPVYESWAMSEVFLPSTKYDTFDTLGLTTGVTNLLCIDNSNPTTSISTLDLPEYLTMLKKIKTWSDDGFWSKSVLSSKEDVEVNFQNGKCAVWFSSLPNKAKGLAEKTALKHPDWKTGFFNYNDMNGLIYPARANHNLMAVVKGSQNAERALMVLEKFHTDKNYYDLTQYGIKGLNYNLNGEKLDYTNIDMANHYFDISPWAWRNKPFIRENVADWPGYKEIDNKLSKVAKKDPYDGFVFDISNIQSELAAISQVQTQYQAPLEAGLVKDTEASLTTLKQKLKDAGFDKFKAEVDKQLKAFNDQKKK